MSDTPKPLHEQRAGFVGAPGANATSEEKRAFWKMKAGEVEAERRAKLLPLQRQLEDEIAELEAAPDSPERTVGLANRRATLAGLARG